MYSTTDTDGNIISAADWPFPGSTSCPCDVVRYPNGRMYRTDELPPVYGLPGSSEQQFGGDCPAGWGVMAGPRPDDVKDATGFVTATWIAGADGEWAPKATVTPETIKQDKIDALKKELDALDAKYLTPRVLAGLATGDAYAQSQWTQHEAEASPIRTQISELLANTQ